MGRGGGALALCRLPGLPLAPLELGLRPPASCCRETAPKPHVPQAEASVWCLRLSRDGQWKVRVRDHQAFRLPRPPPSPDLLCANTGPLQASTLLCSGVLCQVRNGTALDCGLAGAHGEPASRRRRSRAHAVLPPPPWSTWSTSDTTTGLFFLISQTTCARLRGNSCFSAISVFVTSA